MASAHYQAQQYAHHAKVGIAEGGVGKAEIPQHRQQEYRQEGDQQAVGGFDDSDVVQACYPALTSVQIPCRKMGDMAAEMILRKLAGEVLQDGTQTIEFESHKRQST
ncbi:substrate-binding domain-containing protein [Aeromonas rivipollensis]|uniref:substrate-binding domain-containing protein n=1 Tax=Aeromonas rivipollensis TaxID=948519 RepID=UPI003B9687E9